MLPLALATSIDVLAAGISFAFLDVDIVPGLNIWGLFVYKSKTKKVQKPSRFQDFFGGD